MLGAWGGAGTRVEVFLGPSLPVTEMSLRWAKRAIKLAQGEDFKGKTSPFWYDVDSFFELCQAAGDRSVRDLIADFDGCSGKNASMIAAGFLGQPAGSLTRTKLKPCYQLPGRSPGPSGRSGWGRSETSSATGHRPTITLRRINGMSS